VKYLRASLRVGASRSCLLSSRIDSNPLLNAFNKGLVFSFGHVSLPSLAILPALVFLRLGLSLGMPIAFVLSLASSLS
jgi:hypothetical protein